jgi:hypothetical protein
VQYFANAPNVGLHAPAMQSFPLLYDDQGTVLSNDRMRADSVTHPRLLGPSLVAKGAPTRAVLASVIGSDSVPEDVSNDLSSDPAKAKRNWVAFDLREPRAQFGQEWQVTFEGIIPPLTGREGRLRCAAADKKPCEGGENPSNFVLVDPSIGFCDQGAQGAALSQSLGLPAGDIVQIVEPLPDPADPYWGTVAAICSPTSCQSAYGPPDVPTAGRDLEVDVSFQDHLVLKPNPNRGPGAPLECCFPYPTSYNVRVGKQWLVTGAATGYAHHIIPDPTAADPSAVRCINSCDPSLRLRNSRAVEVPVPDPMSSDPAKIPSFDDADKGPGAPSDPRIFRNAQIRFVLWKAEKCTVDPCVTRGSKFSFVESGGFASIEIQLSTVPVLPQSIRFVRGISQLAIPDAVSQGLLLFDLNVMSSNGVKAFF